MPSQKPVTDKLRTNSFSMLIVVVGLIAAAAYGTVVLTTRDWVWFLNGFDPLPRRVVVYDKGVRTEYLPGQNGYIELAEAARASLASGAVRPSGIGLSAGSLQDAYGMYLSVEVFFAEPVKLHAWFNTDGPNQMLFLMTGRHSDQPIVFLGLNNQYMANGPILKTVEPIRAALKTLGYTFD